jgi:hypothetical protein
MSNYSPAQPADIWGQASGSGSGGRDGGDGISNINPDDIENISVLKEPRHPHCTVHRQTTV